MSKTCPSCGTPALPAARFCRLCGIPLPSTSEPEEPSSPLAVTVRLSQDRKARNTASDSDPSFPNSTRRVGPEELEEILGQTSEAKLLHEGIKKDSIPAVGNELSSSKSSDENQEVLNFAEEEFSFKTGNNTEELDDKQNSFVEPLRAALVVPEQTKPKSDSPYLFIAGGVVFLIIGAAIGGFLYKKSTSRVPVASSVSSAQTNVSILTIKERMAEVQASLSSGDKTKAVGQLREIIQLDSSNVEAYKQLGNLLVESGQRQEAIKVYKSAIEYLPSDASLWQMLASMQFDDGAYEASVESYNRLLAISGVNLNDAAWLTYANALRMTGKLQEAVAIYQRLSTSNELNVANVSKQHLASLKTQTALNKDPYKRDDMKSQQPAEPIPTPNILIETSATPHPTPEPTPVPKPVSLSPIEHYNRGVELWSQNRSAAIAEFHAAKNIPDAHYYLGLAIVEGRDPSGLTRADLVSALLHFQIAQNGRHGAQSRRYADLLGGEYDRRKRQQK